MFIPLKYSADFTAGFSKDYFLVERNQDGSLVAYAVDRRGKTKLSGLFGQAVVDSALEFQVIPCGGFAKFRVPNRILAVPA